MLRAAFTSACSAKPHDVHRKVDWFGRLALATWSQLELSDGLSEYKVGDFSGVALSHGSGKRDHIVCTTWTAMTLVIQYRVPAKYTSPVVTPRPKARASERPRCGSKATSSGASAIQPNAG